MIIIITRLTPGHKGVYTLFTVTVDKARDPYVGASQPQLSVALESTTIALHAMCADWEACGRRPAKAWTLSTHDCVSIGSPDPHSSEAFVQPGDSGDLMFALVPVLAD